MSEEQNTQLVVKMMDLAFNQRDVEAAGELHSETFVGTGPGYKHTGRAGAIAGLRTFTDAFTETEVRFEHLIADGDRVVAHFLGTCLHTGEFQGVAPSGRAVSVHGVIIAKVEGSQIAQLWFTLNWDGLT